MPPKRKESKKARKERLQRDGWWRAFLYYRDKVLRPQEGWTPNSQEEEDELNKHFGPYGYSVPECVRHLYAPQESFSPVLKKPDPKTKDQEIPAETKDPELEKLDPLSWDGRKADTFDVVMWVFENMETTVRPEDAPSPGAWSYLKMVRKNSEAKEQFYANIWPKTLPNKTQISRQGDFEDADPSLELVKQALNTSE